MPATTGEVSPGGLRSLERLNPREEYAPYEPNP